MTCSACGATAGQEGRFCPMCGSPLRDRESEREARKKVAILFIDIVGFTALTERLDPEVLRHIMDRYFAGCAAAITAHGGVVEKFIGDAVMAVFGAAVSHEDDALRAVRAAADSLDAVRELDAELVSSHREVLEARCGICWGEVVVITAPDGDFRVVGDPVNTASRLQAAAAPGEIFIDAGTSHMVRAEVGLEPVPPLSLKGKAKSVPAWRVRELQRPGSAGPADRGGPFVGREDELDEMRHGYRRVMRRRQPCLVTLVGAPGLGKSRLVREFLADLPDSVTVLTGRCSAYGRGITYQPLAEVLESYPGGWAGLADSLEVDPDPGRRAVARLSTIAGPGPEETDASFGVEEIAWAARSLFEILGRAGPLVVVWEDLHWAETTLLDLIDDVATWLSDVPVLLLCAARPELLDARPSWGGGKPSAMTLELSPLTREQSAELVSELALHSEVYPQHQDDDYARVAVECDGNPLFAELMLDVFAETGAGANVPGASIPPPIHALLGARLDQIPRDERQILELAAVIGREFGLEVLLAIADEDGLAAADARELLGRLVRRRLIQRAAPGTYRFVQALLRDTAYAFTSKSRRECWHEFLARWYSALRSAAGHGAAQDIAIALAYHLETAWMLRRELRPGDASLPELAAEAAGVLIAEGTTAMGRKDLPAGAALLERGRGLLPPGDENHRPLALRISDAWLGLWDAGRALAVLSAAEAALPGDRRAHATCEIQRMIVALRLAGDSPAEIEVRAGRMAADLAAGGADDLSWCRFLQLQAYLHLAAERSAEAEAALRVALTRAQSRTDTYEEERILCTICELAQWTPTKVSTGLALCAEVAGRVAANRVLLVPILVTQARLTALAGDLDGARGTAATALRYATDLHLDLAAAAAMDVAGFVESLAGAHDEAESCRRRAAAVLRSGGQDEAAQAMEAEVARALFSQGRTADAGELLDRLAADPAVLSLRTKVTVTALHGRLAAARGDGPRAVTLAREAARLVGLTQDPCLHGDTFLDLAIVLGSAGRADEAARAAATALEQYEAKGAVMSAAAVRRGLSADRGTAPSGTAPSGTAPSGTAPSGTAPSGTAGRSPARGAGTTVPRAVRAVRAAAGAADRQGPPWRQPRRGHFPGVPAWGAPTAGMPEEIFGISPLAEITQDWAWGGATGSGARICVLDSGIDAAHPLVGGIDRSMTVVAEAGGECRVAETEPADLAGHGTACASVIRSIAPGASLASMRVLTDGKRGSGAALLAGLSWAIDEGFDVINMSVSTTKDQFSLALHELADRAYFRRCMLVASAHNMPVRSFPWAFSSVISVASHDEPEPMVYYYNPSPPVEFYARGVRVRVAWPGGGQMVTTGNSFATPHMAGICALILSKHPLLTPFQLKSVLYQAASNVTRNLGEARASG